MRKTFLALAAAGAALALAACGHGVEQKAATGAVAGAVVGGPVGAAAGLAVQGLLGHGLNKTVGARYHVTGSWDKPVMTLVEKHGLPAAPATTKPPLLPAASSSSSVITMPLRDSLQALPAAASSTGR